MKNMNRVCKIKEIMCNADINSDTMRERLGLSERTMHDLEFGLPVSEDILKKVSETFKVPLSELA